MAVIEYMLHKDGHKRQVPDFVGDRGHWCSPLDNTFIGWVDDVRDYYVPDTVVSLTKQQFIDRLLGIHQQVPYTKPNFDVPETPNPEVMTVEEVTAMAGTWYDDFVAKNSA